MAGNNLARLDTKRSVCGIVVGHCRSHSPIQQESVDAVITFVALVDFFSSGIVVWSPSAPQVGMLYMFLICCFLFH